MEVEAVVGGLWFAEVDWCEEDGGDVEEEVLVVLEGPLWCARKERKRLARKGRFVGIVVDGLVKSQKRGTGGGDAEAELQEGERASGASLVVGRGRGLMEASGEREVEGGVSIKLVSCWWFVCTVNKAGCGWSLCFLVFWEFGIDCGQCAGCESFAIPAVV